MKHLRKYLEFIKESLETDSIWKIDENKIREFLIELEDAEYLISVTFVFVGKEEQIYKSKYSQIEPEDIFTEKILANELTKPAIQIEIKSGSKTSNNDVTDDFLAALSAIEMECDAEIELHDDGGELNQDDLLIKGGIFTGVEPDDEYSGTEIDPLKVFVKLNNQIKLNPRQLADFYGWKCDEETEDNIYVHVDLEDMVDYILSNRSRWTKMLLGGEEELWDHYDISYYFPDVYSLFQTLDKENSNLLIKAVIKEAGGLDDIKRHIGDECDNDVYDKVKDMLEEELIDYLIKERFNNTIKQLGRNSEIWSDINQTVADYELSAHLHDNYRELISEFDSCVEDEFKFTKIEKDGEKLYRIQFDNKWIEDLESEDIFKYNLDGIFKEYCENLERYDLDPRFSDYGDVDTKKLNSEINSILTKYLKK
jgi:hypothetical protein